MNNIVITGIGLVTPLGFGREKNWNALIDGLSAVKRDKEFTEIVSARLEGLPVPDQVRLVSIAFLAVNEALHDSGIKIDEMENAGCTISVSKQNLFSSGTGDIVINEAFYPNNTGMQIKRIFKLKGPCRNIVAACATGAGSIILGAQWIRDGLCDMVLCGAAESSFHPLYVAGFSRMGVLAANNAAPFDKDREGFAMAEGAGILVLERKDKAVLRCAKIYGEISGWDMSNSLKDAVSFSSDGKEISESINRALNMAGVDQIDYINAHGTGTEINDIIETRAVKNVFGVKAKEIAISSTKAATGHLLGAAGAVEAIFALLAMRDQVVPPTLNLKNADPECDLNYTPLKSQKRKIDLSMSLSFGFGGQIGTVIFKKI